MSQSPNNFAVTVTTAGTRVQIVSPTSALRFVKSATFTAPHGNAGNIYLGNSLVSSTLYSVVLAAKETAVYGGDQVNRHPGDDNNLIDLSAVYVDAANNGDKVFVTVQER